MHIFAIFIPDKESECCHPDIIGEIEIFKMTPEEKLCLICVYMYARGTSDGDVGILQVLDELHEIVEKFKSTHRIIIGRDFNSSLHRSSPTKRDRLLKEFLEEHSLGLLDHYPEKVMYRHDGTGASSLTDYWILSNTEGSMVEVGDSKPLNLSDHVHVSLQIQRKSLERDTPIPPGEEAPLTIKHRIRWDKSDPDMYQSILQDSLQPILLYQPSCHFDVDVLVNSLNSKLYQASVAASPKLNTQTRKRNDKNAHREWKAAGSPRNPSSPYVQHRKEACTLMRRVIRQTSI